MLERVKKATVYLRVTLANGRTSQGTGFFATQPGLVLTNAHVLGMLEGRRRPRHIDVVLDSGERGERTLTGQLLAVHRASDLAVLRVSGPDLPAPLQVKPASGLRETEQVFVFGFPFGEDLGKNITVSTSSVSSLRKDRGGALERVQVNGGMHPGNSGGPVVTARGDVIGVAVSVILNSQIHFAIPGEHVQGLLEQLRRA